MANDKEQMSTKERVDDAKAEMMADAESNKEEIIEPVQACFAKAFPRKFKPYIHKWAYIDAKGSGAYYKTPDGNYFKRTGDIPENVSLCTKCVSKSALIKSSMHTSSFMKMARQVKQRDSRPSSSLSKSA